MLILICSNNETRILNTSYDLYTLYNDWVSINDEAPDESLTEILEAIRDQYTIVWENFNGTYSIEVFESIVKEFLLERGLLS